MMLKTQIFIVLLASYFESGLSGDTKTLDFLQDYFRNAKPFTQVTAVACRENFRSALTHLLRKGEFLHLVLEPMFAANIVNKITAQEKVLFVVKLNCPGSLRFLLKAGEKGLYHTPQKHWLLLMEEPLSANENQLMGKLKVFINGSMTLAQRTNTNTSRGITATYTMYEIFKLGYRSPLKWIPIGYWSDDKPVVSHRIYPINLHRRQLDGLEIPISIVVTHPETLSLLDSLHHKYDDTSTKMNYHLIQHVFDVMNASAKFVTVDSWGYEENGTYNGMVGQVLRGQVEIGGTPLLINRDRIEILEYLGITSHSKFRFIFRQPRLSSVGNIFLLPFGASVWVSSFAMLVLASIFLYSTIKTEKIYYENNIDVALELVKFGDQDLANDRKLKGWALKMAKVKFIQDSWSDITLLTLGALCQQGFPAEARGAAGRIVTIFLFLTIIVLYTSYAASIVVLLQMPGATISTLQDLYESPIKLGLDEVIAQRHIFQEMKEPLKVKIYNKIAPPGRKPAFFTMEEGISKIRGGLFAFHVELGSGYEVIRETFTEDEMCSLQEVNILPKTNVWLVMRKKSPFKKIFIHALTKVLEFGLSNREENRWVSKKPECNKRHLNFEGVGLVDIRHALLMFGVGFSLSWIFLCSEIMLNRRQKKKKAKKKASRRVHHS